MTLFGMTTECDDECVMAVSPQIYSNTTIELDAPDENWNDTASAGSAIYGTDIPGQQMTSEAGISSTEGGKVWHIETITIPAFD